MIVESRASSGKTPTLRQDRAEGWGNPKSGYERERVGQPPSFTLLAPCPWRVRLLPTPVTSIRCGGTGARMNLLARLPLLVGLAVLFSPLSVAENKQEEGEKLIRQAGQISDIRSADGPAFRLKASFKPLGDDAPAGEGTYTEIWVSRGRWRRESIIGSFHRTEVGGEKTLWIVDGTQGIPGRTGQLGTLMQVGVVHQKPIKVAAIRDESVQGVPARCIELKAQQRLGKETLCVDAQSGVLLLSKTPSLWMGQKSEYVCEYGEYEKFADRMYPRHMRCVEGRRSGIEVRVLELSTEPSPDAASFTPPAGATELANCPGTVQAPKALQTPDPQYPKGEREPRSPEVIYLIVGVDGKPRDLRVAHSLGKAFDSRALEAVRRWVFKPATCNGDPVPVPVNVELNFRNF